MNHTMDKNGFKSEIKTSQPLKIATIKRTADGEDTILASPSKKIKYDKENVAPAAGPALSPKFFKSKKEIRSSSVVHIKEENVDHVVAESEPTEKKMSAKKLEREFQKQEIAKKKALKHEEQQQMQAIKREQSYKALKYLLSKSVVYTKFLEERFEANHSKAANDKSKKINLKNQVDIKQIKTSSSESPKLEDPVIKKIKQPKLFENGILRDYQLDGLEWLKVLYENGINGILADEMGLGKTVQVIAFICYLYERGITGPILICVPLSTVPNWVSEFERFAPKLPVILYHGTKDARKELNRSILKRNFVVGNMKDCSPVVITSFDTPMREAMILSQRSWKYIMVDEGHRLKNHKTILFRTLQSYKSINRLLVTGTPLQNNLRELWSLLHFLLPDIFSDYEIFESWMDIDELKNNSEKFIQQEQETQVLSMMHNILKPFMLRRLKSDVELDLPPKKEVIVYCPLTKKQRDLYKFVLERDMKSLDPDNAVFAELPAKRQSKSRYSNYKEYSSDSDDSEFEYRLEEDDCSIVIQKPEKDILTRLTMQNRMMMYRKIVNHPYLVHFPIVKDSGKSTGRPELRIDEDLVKQSGKMMMLDAMTSKLIKMGHKILIFSTLTLILDIIEDFVLMRGYEYCRLDGGYSLDKRKTGIHEFNTNPDVKIFLISTRAGGLGLNLVGADTVILFDSDWNPQVDIQAQDRCHRIGQTRPVMVYQFVTRGTIDETIVATGDKKRKLEKLIIQSDKFKLKGINKDTNAASTLEYLKKLLSEDERHIASSVDELLSAKELDELLDRSELYEQMKNAKMKKL